MWSRLSPIFWEPFQYKCLELTISDSGLSFEASGRLRKEMFLEELAKKRLDR